MRLLIVVVMAAASVPASALEPFTLTIDPALSQASFELCAFEVCDTDTSPVAGSLVIDLDDPIAPASMHLYDYQFILTQTLNLHLPFIIGALDVTMWNKVLMYPNPGQPHGPAEINGDAFVFFDVPAIAQGTAYYIATGLACSLISGMGLPCEATFDLTKLGEQTADTMGGTITIDGDDVTMVIEVDMLMPVIPDDPGVAQIHFIGTIVATGVLPMELPGDSDGDGDVDLLDFRAFLECETGPAGIAAAECQLFDFDEDDDIDRHDFAAFQHFFTGG